MLKKRKKDCVSSLVKQQSVNQGLSFPPLHSESCQSCRSTLMSIFSCTFSPTLSRHSAWYISSLSDPSISTHFHFSAPLFLLLPFFSSFMAYSCTVYTGFGWGLVGRGLWGWAMVGLHVFERTEIFMYVCLCLCVRATSRVCLCCIFFPLFYQVMHKALSFDSAPKIRLDTSITHELLCTRSHDPLRRRN